jgi:hypothetical protein
MPKLTLTFVSRRSVVGVGLVFVVFVVCLAGSIGVSMLPARLFGSTLTTAEAEDSIRAHLVSQTATHYAQRLATTTRDDRYTLEAQYFTEVEVLKALVFVSVDVNKSIFSAFSMNPHFVVKTVMRGKDHQLSTRYFCFQSKYLLGQCSKWQRFFTW